MIMIANQKKLYKLAQRWTDADIKHLTWLQLVHPTYYKYLQQIQNFGPLHPNKMTFRMYNTPTKLCITNQNNYFHCYDCSLMTNAGLCTKCFDFNKHKGHQWSYIQMKNKFYCDCGNKSKILPQCMCQFHKKELHKEGQTLSLQEVNFFNVFYTIYLKLLIAKIEDKVYKSWNYFGNLMNFLIELNDKNLDYNKATCEMLNTVYAKNSTQKNILRKLFQISFKNQTFTQQMLKLFIILKNCDQFEQIFAQALFKQNKSYGNYQEPALLKYFHQQVQNFQILNNLATKGIINYQSTNDYETKILKFYTQIIEKKEKNNNSHLIQVWKHMFKQRKNSLSSGIILKCRQARKNQISNYFFIVMMDSLIDCEFFQQLINFYIQKWTNLAKQSYQSRSTIYNQFVRICLHAVKGQINQFPNLFQNCNKDKLTKFIYSYLSQILDPSFSKCRFNNLTMKCILKVIQRYNLNCFNPNCMSSSYSSLKFARILAIVIRNMTAYKYNEDYDIYKIAMQTKNIDLANQKQQKILKWFKQFLFMKGEISKNLIKQFEFQGITNIKKIKEFFITSTNYKKTNNLFSYIGQQVPSNLNILLDILYTKNQIYGIHWDDSKNLFYNQDNCEMLTCLFSKVIEKVQLESYSSYQNSYKYLVCVTAVLLNKITNQQNQKFKQYVLKLRQISESFKKPNPQVQRLFRIKSYKIKQQNEKKEILIKKQETTISNQINQPINKIQQIQKTIQMSQKLEKLQIEEKQQEIQVPKIIQKTPSQARRHQKKNEKMKKFSQKLANRSQKFLDSSKKIQQTSQQVCLVCKEPTNNFSLLFYYGSLQKNKSTLLYKLYTNNKQKLDLNFNLTSCYHSIHQTCSQKFSKKCILCSTPSDLLIPVVQKSFDNETKNIFLIMWWNENFKTTLNKKGVNSKLANQLYFFILFKSLVANLGLKSLVTSKSIKNSSNKNRQALQFLNQIYKAHQNKQKLSIILEIEQYIKQNSLQNAKFMNKIQSILSTLILSKLQNDLDKPNIQIEKWVYEKLQQLSKQFEFMYSQQIVKNIGQLVGRQYQQFNEIFKNKPEAIQLWKHLQILKEVPQNLRILKQSSKLCPKCNYPTSYYCISCNTNICSKCVNVGVHLKTQRCIAIDFQGWIVYEQDNNMIKNPLYLNFLYDTCRSNKSNWSDYKFDKNALYEVVNKIISQ